MRSPPTRYLAFTGVGMNRRSRSGASTLFEGLNSCMAGLRKKVINGLSSSVRILAGSENPGWESGKAPNNARTHRFCFGELIGEALGTFLKEIPDVLGPTGNYVAAEGWGALQKKNRLRGGDTFHSETNRVRRTNLISQFTIQCPSRRELIEFRKESNRVGQELDWRRQAMCDESGLFLGNIGPVIRDECKPPLRQGRG